MSEDLLSLPVFHGFYLNPICTTHHTISNIKKTQKILRRKNKYDQNIMEFKISPPKILLPKKVCCNESNGEKGKCSIEVGLNLELGYSKFSRNGYGFTFLQRQELEQQFFIYKNIEAGLPVPSHLIIPICKSFNCSLKGLHDGNYPHCTNLMGYGNLCWEHKSSMEAEPRRCRRTDGKKWRCSKSVVQNQKYCEKHMHRGRQRSRKCVELTTNLCCSDS